MERDDAEILSHLAGVLEARNAEEAMLAKALEDVHEPAPEPEPDYPRMAAEARVFIAKAERAQHDHALAALSGRDMSGPAGLAKSASPGDLAALARVSRRVELRERIAAQPPADHRGRLPWQVNPTTASVDEQVAAVEALGAHDLPSTPGYLGPS